MEVHFSPELESKVTDSAARQSRNPDELVQDIVSHYIEDETRFVEAVKHDEEALQQGEYLTASSGQIHSRRFCGPRQAFIG